MALIKPHTKVRLTIISGCRDTGVATRGVLVERGAQFLGVLNILVCVCMYLIRYDRPNRTKASAGLENRFLKAWYVCS